MGRFTRRIGNAALVAGLVTWLACGGEGHGSRTHAEHLSSDDIALYARVLAASDARVPDTASFARAVAADNRSLRTAGVRAIGQVHAVTSVPLLERTLTDPDSAVAATAAYALGLVRDSASVPALTQALGGPPSVGVEAAWALGEIGEPARVALTAALTKSDRSATAVDESLLLAVAKLRPVPMEAVRPFLSLDSAASMSAPRQAVVRAAAYAVARPRVAAGTRALAGLASSTDLDTRVSVARGLTRGAAGDSLAVVAREALIALVDDRDPNVRATAVQSLASFGEATRDRVTAALRDSATNVRVAAAGVLDRVLGKQRPAWDSASATDTSFAVGRVVAVAAARVGVVLAAIDPGNPSRWQRSADWRHRSAAADAAASLSLARLLTVIGPLLHDPDGRVRVAAYNAIGPWIDSTGAPGYGAVRSAISAGLDDADPFVRSIALGALDDRARSGDAQVGLRGYRRARTDSVADARLAALQLMSAAWLRDSAHVPDSIRSAIAELAPSSDLREDGAVGAGSIWAAWHGRRVIPPIHPLVWYDSVVQAVVVPTLAGHPLVATIRTVRGPLTITLFGDVAPLTVANFVALARASYYRGTTFHRVVPAFVVQDGDPRGDGSGGPAYAIRDEFNRSRYGRGTLGMALSGPNTGGSQYFLTVSPQPHLDGHYTAFGALRDGFQRLDRIVQGDSIADVVVE